MSARMSVGKAGIVLGAVIGGWHVIWSMLVAIGWAQPVIDFVFWMHFIKPIYVIEPFEIERAAILLIVTTVVGVLVGSTFASIWNALHKA